MSLEEKDFFERLRYFLIEEASPDILELSFTIKLSCGDVETYTWKR